MKAMEANATGTRNKNWVVFNSKTYAMILYLLLSLPLGIIYFTVAITGISLSIGLTPIFIGIPLFFGVAKLLNMIVNFEQGMIRQFLDLPAPPVLYNYTQQNDAKQGLFKRMRKNFSGQLFIRDLMLILLRFVTGILFFTITVTLLSVGLALIVSPIVHLILLKEIQIDILENSLFSYLQLDLSNTQQYIVYVVAGIVIFWAALHIVRGLMQIQSKMMLVEEVSQQQPPAPVEEQISHSDIAQYYEKINEAKY